MQSEEKCRNAFKTHEGSECHGDFDHLLKDEKTSKNLRDEVSDSFEKNKANKKKTFFRPCVKDLVFVSPRFSIPK